MKPFLSSDVGLSKALSVTFRHEQEQSFCLDQLKCL